MNDCHFWCKSTSMITSYTPIPLRLLNVSHIIFITVTRFNPWPWMTISTSLPNIWYPICWYITVQGNSHTNSYCVTGRMIEENRRTCKWAYGIIDICTIMIVMRCYFTVYVGKNCMRSNNLLWPAMRKTLKIELWWFKSPKTISCGYIHS